VHSEARRWLRIVGSAAIVLMATPALGETAEELRDQIQALRAEQARIKSNFDDDLQFALDQAYVQVNLRDFQLYGGKVPQPFTRTDLASAIFMNHLR
jgi:hypothetical protein